MKKFFAVLTTFLATFLLVACHNTSSTSDNTELSSLKLLDFLMKEIFLKILKRSLILPTHTQVIY